MSSVKTVSVEAAMLAVPTTLKSSSINSASLRYADLLSRVYTRTHVAGHAQVVSTCIHLVAVNMFLVSATKLLPVCRPSVVGYKGIQADRDINEQ